MGDCEICGINIEDEHYEQYGRCQNCYNNYTDCSECGKHLEYYMVFNNCFEYDFCNSCFTNQMCKIYKHHGIICTKCCGCYECCDKICGKLKKDEIIRLVMYINLPNDLIKLILFYL